VYVYFVVISVNVRGLFCWGVCTGLFAIYLDIKKDKTIFRMAEYQVSLKYDIFICRLLSYLCL
jgi:sulfite exporter TauE/SafE